MGGCSATIAEHAGGGAASFQHKELAAMAIKAEKAAAGRMQELCIPDNGKAVRIAAQDAVSFRHGDTVVASFPGVHGYAWNYLMQHCNQMNGIKTSCTFLKDRHSPGYGLHSYVSNKGLCACHHLYDGEVQDFGCLWYEQWRNRTDKAAHKGCKLIVVTKSDRTLGRSQKAEVLYMKNMRYTFKTMTVEQFVNMVWEPVLVPLRQMRASGTNSLTNSEALAEGYSSEGSFMGSLDSGMVASQRSSRFASELSGSRAATPQSRAVTPQRNSSKNVVQQRSSSRPATPSGRPSTTGGRPQQRGLTPPPPPAPPPAPPTMKMARSISFRDQLMKVEC